MSSRKIAKSTANHWRFYMPHYWPLWILIGLFWLLVHLPFRLQMWMGKGLGRFMMWISPNAKRVARINLRHCFPEYDEPKREAIMRESFANLGRALFETGMGFWLSDKRLKKLAHFHGAEHLDRLKTSERGVVLLGAHLTTLEVVGRLCAMRYTYSVMYRPHKIAFLDLFIKRGLSKHYQSAIGRHDLRQMIRRLKKGEWVWYSPDVNPGRKSSVFAPFFHLQAATVKAPTKFAQLTNCQFVPVFNYRRSDGKGYDIEILPVVSPFPSGDLVKDATTINQLIETAIRKHPEQYLWQYMRFKTRPEGEPRVYSRRYNK
jgi:Kdo2-lipid IVA lauroyltransferase/acyltransferase